MANRLLTGFNDWKAGKSAGGITPSGSSALNTSSNRLVSDFADWQKKRKPAIDQVVEQQQEQQQKEQLFKAINSPEMQAVIQLEKEQSQTPPAAKPVDQVQQEKKSLWQPAGTNPDGSMKAPEVHLENMEQNMPEGALKSTSEAFLRSVSQVANTPMAAAVDEGNRFQNTIDAFKQKSSTADKINSIGSSLLGVISMPLTTVFGTPLNALKELHYTDGAKQLNKYTQALNSKIDNMGLPDTEAGNMAKDNLKTVANWVTLNADPADLAKMIDIPFGWAGFGGKKITESALNNLPVSDQTKESLRPFIGEAGSLLGQVGFGMAMEYANQKYTDIMKGKNVATYKGGTLENQVLSKQAYETINEFSDTKIDVNSTPDQVKLAYREAASKIHPDKTGGEDFNMKRVNAAKDFLDGNLNPQDLFKNTKTETPATDTGEGRVVYQGRGSNIDKTINGVDELGRGTYVGEKSTAEKFGETTAFKLNIKDSEILKINSEADFLAFTKGAEKAFPDMDLADAKTAFAKQQGYKAIEASQAFDELGGINVLDKSVLEPITEAPVAPVATPPAQGTPTDNAPFVDVTKAPKAEAPANAEIKKQETSAVPQVISDASKQKITKVLDILGSGDIESVDTATDNMTTDELKQIVTLLDHASGQATPEQKSVIVDHKDLIQTIADERANKINDAVGKDIIENTAALNELSDIERKEAVGVIGKLSEANAKISPQAQTLKETIDTNNGIIDQAMKSAQGMKEELLKKKSEAETPQLKAEVQTQIDKLDDQRIVLKNSQNKASIADVIATLSPELKNSIKDLTANLKERIITNNNQSYGSSNQNIGRGNNAGGNAGVVSVGKSEPTRLGRSSAGNGGQKQTVNRVHIGNNGKRVSERQQLKVGDVIDTQGNSNMVGKVTVSSIEKNSVHFTDEKGTTYSAFSASTAKDLIEGGSWKRVGEKVSQKEAVAGSIKETPKTIKQIAEETKILEPNVRRILGVGAKEGVFERVDKGVYILSKDGVDTAYIHTGDALETLPKLAADGFKADMIFLDIPYKTAGVIGGSRGIDYDTLSSEDFKNIVIPAVKTIARTDDSPIVYMYSNSKSGMVQMIDYNNKIIKSGLQIVAKGTYSKTYKSGAPMKFGKYLMPPEGILVFNKSGNDVALPSAFDVKAVAPLYKGHYQTEKAHELLQAIIRGTTKVGDMVLDPFAGSGVTGEQAIKEGRKTILIEKSSKAVEEHIKPRIEKALGETKKYTKAEIETLAMSHDHFTDEEKNILRQYEGSGGQKEGEGRGLLDEYYTPPEVIDKVWQLVKQYVDGKIDTVVEPSVGTGRFIEGAPKDAKVVGYETNPVSAKIAKVLYPESTIHNKSFEDVFTDEKGNKKAYPKGMLDAVVGNPPYGIHRGMYKGLGEEPKIGRYEEYFLKRSLDLVREGGIVAMVVPSGFLRGKVDYVKNEIAKMAELVDAYRLPNKSFGTTDIGTDIVIFKKRPVLTGAGSDERIAIVSRETKTSNDIYFRDVMNQDKVLGTATTIKGRFGIENYTEGTLSDAMQKMKLDDQVAEEQAVEEFNDEDKEAVEMEQPLTPEIKTEAIRATRIAKRKPTRAQGLKKDMEVKGVLKRSETEPYIVNGTKKGATKTFSQGNELTAQDQKFLDATREDGSIHAGDLSETENAVLNYANGDYFTDFNYYQGDIYEKLSQLERDKSKITAEQYDKQKKQLETIKPEVMPINKITLLPIDRLSKDIKISTGETLVDGFTKWIENLPYDAMEGSSRWEIAGYLNGQPVRGGNIEQNVKERTRRRRVGNKLFKKYYTEELEAVDQTNITDNFNRTFNSYVKPDYAQYPLSVDLFGKFYGKDFEMRPIQMEGAAFLVNKGVGLLAYEVGVGKTLAGIAAISDVMKKGWAKKPLIIVPKNLKSKWIRDLSESMPNVKINDLSNLGGNFKYKGKPEDLQIGEGSISIITEDGFKRIGFTPDTYNRLTANLEDVLYEDKKMSKRNAEISKAKTEEIVGLGMKKTDFPVTFEKFGFDHITIDEAHRSKNIFSKAKAKGEKGASANEYGAIHGAMSERGLKTYLATQYVLGENGGRNVFLLTATPFNNSPIEIYSMLSLMAKARLEGLGIKNINDFISMFCEIETRYAIKANGNVQLSDQVRKFSNLQQLQKLVREYIDFRTGEEAGIPRPTKQKITPQLKMNSMQADYVEKAQELFSPKFRQEGGTLLAISELQKITFSPYLSRYNTRPISSIKPKELVDNSPKIKYAVEAIKKAHEANPNVGQIMFAEKGVELFRLIRDYFLKELHYKPNEVEIIDSSCSDAVKDDIQDRFQNGEVKVLLASGTVKEGVDLQKNSTDLYNLYLQWNPTDMIQAEGRTWRQGSYYDKVRIHYPLIQNSIDPFIFQKLEEKASRISNVFSYKGDSLDVSDIDFENMKFELITDPVMRVNAKYEYDKADIENKVTVAEAEIAFMERRTGKIAELTGDIESYTARKKEAIANDDESDVTYYSEKLTKRKAELAEEQAKLDKKGINVADVAKEVATKNEELTKLRTQREELATQLSADLEVAKEQKHDIISGNNDYGNILDFMKNKAFFTHQGEEFLGRLPASFKKGEIHDNIQDKDVYARLMMVRTPFSEFKTTTERLLKQHGMKMNVEMFHTIIDKMTNEKALGITWGDTIGAMPFVTRFTAHHEVLHAVEDALIRSKIISTKMGYDIKQLPEFGRFNIDTLNKLTAQRTGGNPKNMVEMREKRAELFEQYVERKERLTLPQRLKEYFQFLLKQFLRVHGFLKQVGMMSFFDQLYYGKSKGERTIVDQNFVKRMTRYEMNEKGQMTKSLNLTELEIKMEFGDNMPSYKKADESAQEDASKPLIADGHINVQELYKKVYSEFYEGEPPAMNTLEDQKLTTGMTKRAFTLGKRFGTKVTKENYKEVQKEIRNYIIKNIPPKNRGELLRAVINAKSKADVEIVIEKVNDMVEKGKGREIASAKKDLMKEVYQIFLNRGMIEKSTGRVNGGMLRQAVQHVVNNDGRVKMRQLTIPELEQLRTIATTLTQDKLGRIQILNDIKRGKINDLLPEELRGKEFVTMGDIEKSIANKDITGSWLGIFNKNLFRAGRFVMIKNEITKQMYDKFTTAERLTANQEKAFDEKLSKLYKDATGKMTSFRDKNTDKKVIDYLEGRSQGADLNENQMKLANEIVQFYAESVDVMKPNRLRKYYFTHTRQNFMESVNTVGFKATIAEFFNKEFMDDFYKDLPPEIAANLEYIVANKVFNPFGLPRKGNRFSQDLRKAMQTYAKVYFIKKNFDSLYAQSNAVMNILPPNLQTYFRRYLQSSKGRPEGKAFNPLIKKALEKATTWEYIKILGGNLASGIFNIVVGTIDNFAAMGIFTKDSLALGNSRYVTPKGWRMIKEYRVADQNVTYEMTQLMHTIPELANKIMFFQMEVGEHWLRGTAFLSLITNEEYKLGKVSDKRMQEIRHRIGEAQPLYGKFDSPVYGRHPFGKTMYMYMTWLPTRIENWVNWVVGAVSAMKNEKGFKNKFVENKDLGKILRWGSAFIIMSLLYGDRKRWQQEVQQYENLFDISYWVKLLDPTTKPVWADVINFGEMLKFLLSQEQYKTKGADFQKGDYKWQIYGKRLIEPTVVKRVMTGQNPVTQGWLPDTKSTTINKYQLYNSQ